MPKRSGSDTKSARRFRNENHRPTHRMFRLNTNPKHRCIIHMNHILGYFKAGLAILLASVAGPAAGAMEFNMDGGR